MMSGVQCARGARSAGLCRWMAAAGLRRRNPLTGALVVRAASNDVNTFRETATLRMRNGTKMPTGLFTEGEITGRVTKLRHHMEEAGLAACLFTSIHNINYYSGGFTYCSFGRPYGLLITPEKHVTISALIDAGQPWRRTIQDNIIYTDWKQDNFHRAVVEELGPTRGTVGIEEDHMPIQVGNKLRSHLHNNNTLTDISKAVMRMRMLKSKEEVAVIKNSVATADLGGWACAAALGEGVPEYEVALAGTQAMVRHIANIYPDSELMDTWVWFQSGLNTDGAHNPVTTRRLQKGDILSLNCFPMPQGYYTALERTWFLDHCSDHHLKVWEANVEVHKRGIQLITPGARCCHIAQELNDLYAQFGLLKYRSFGYGHSFGVLSHYYGREAGLEIREDIETVLEPSMVVSMEPMVTIPEGQPGAGGYREHDVLVINEDGTVDNITKFPFGPEHNIFKK